MHIPTCSAHGVRIARDRSLQRRHPIKEHGVGRGGISERIRSTAAPTTGQEHGVEGGKENAATGPSRVDGHALNADARSADARVAHAQRTLRPWRRNTTNFVKKNDWAFFEINTKKRTSLRVGIAVGREGAQLSAARIDHVSRCLIGRLERWGHSVVLHGIVGIGIVASSFSAAASVRTSPVVYVERRGIVGVEELGAMAGTAENGEENQCDGDESDGGRHGVGKYVVLGEWMKNV